MSVHDSIRGAIGSLVGGRYYPNRFPQSPGMPQWPSIRGTIIARTDDPTICGGNELDEDDLLLQLDFVSENYDTTAGLLASAAPLLEALSPALVRQPGAREGWDAETQTHIVSVDFLMQQSSGA